MTKPFMPTTLYIKTHNITGLKYFGKTTADPVTYRGSGTYWLAHLRKHGNDVTTEVIGHFIDKEICVETATAFSMMNNIVGAVNEHNKKIWANQINENGTDGGATRWGPLSEETKQKISKAHLGKTVTESERIRLTEMSRAMDRGHLKGRVVSDSTKQKIKEARATQIFTDETRNKMSESQMGHEVTMQTRNKISKGNTGKVRSEEYKLKLRDRIVSDSTKQKIKEARTTQIFSEETKEKLAGKVVVVDKEGKYMKIPKSQYVAQVGPKDNWEWVAHRSKEAKARFSSEEIVDISHMRR